MKSIQDTMKITNAMYMISSSKMKKAKKKLADTEPYFLCHAGSRSPNSASCAGYGNQYFDGRTFRMRTENWLYLVLLLIKDWQELTIIM